MIIIIIIRSSISSPSSSPSEAGAVPVVEGSSPVTFMTVAELVSDDAATAGGGAHVESYWGV